jgi:serine/threonine protein kinase
MTGTTSPALPATFDQALETVDGAADPQELFGPYDGTLEACLRAGGRTYRVLARLLHPDTAPAGRRDEAGRAFRRLGGLWSAYQQDITGVTGRQVVITTRRRVYSVGEERARGDIATLYKVAFMEGGKEAGGLLKLPRSVTDNDLMEREAAALAKIERDGDPQYRAYVPRLVESFRHRDAKSGTERRANIIERVRGFCSLAEVKEEYPEGLDPRDAAWMWRRLLVAVGYAHRAGVVHGAVVPEHVLIHPKQHGLVLVDWCYATTLGDPGHIPALLDRHAALYPPEVPAKQPPTEATDVHMVTTTVEWLLNPALTPKPVSRFIRGCTLPAEARRPHDAWALLAELDELLVKLYGPRRFRQFPMPRRMRSA